GSVTLSASIGVYSYELPGELPMGAIPTQRETTSRAHGAPECARADATLTGSPLAPGSARAVVRAALAEWTGLALPGTEHLTGRAGDDAELIASELVTNAVVHAGTDLRLTCRLEEGTGALIVEVRDRHPSRAPRGDEPETAPHHTLEYGRGLRLVAALCDAWGVTYRPGEKTVWARLPPGGRPEADGIEAYAADAAPAHDLSLARMLATGTPTATPRATWPSERSAPSETGPGDPGDLPAGAGPWGDAPTAPRDGTDEPPPGTHPLPAAPADDWSARRESHDGAWLGRGALSFLAEASDLLAGQLDEDLVTALTGQLIVPRLADWCAVWLADEATPHGGRGGSGRGVHGTGPARVWHAGEHLIEELRRALEQEPPPPCDPLRPGPAPYPWPAKALATADGTPSGTGVPPGTGTPSGTAPGTALAYPLAAGGRPLGTLVLGRAGIDRFPDEITGLVEDLARRVALAIGAARQYARQATISSVLQRGLLPGAVAEIPGLRSALAHEPCDKGGPSGDFYDLFPAGRGRWCFAVGDVQGKGPEAAVVIGLVRPWLRLLAR